MQLTLSSIFDPPSAPPDGTQVTTQYQPEGVTFVAAAYISNVGGAVAHSGTQVALIEQSRCSGEIRINIAYGRFTSLHQHVQVYARELQSNTPYKVTLQGWGAGGATPGGQPLVSDTEVVGPNGWTLLSVTRPQGDIAFFGMRTDAPAKCTAIDDLSFDTPTTTNPDFGLAFLGSGIGTSPGNTGSGTVTVNRFNGSSGRIQFAISGLPNGVSANISPQILTGNSLSSNVTAALTASSGAPSATGAPVTVTGTALDPTAGDSATPRSVTFPVNVASTYTVIAKSIEVTQGIASAVVLPTRNISDSSLGTLARPLPYSNGQFLLPSVDAVPLVAGRKTIARVFTNDVPFVEIFITGAPAHRQP